MAGRSASCYGTSDRGKDDVFTDLNIYDYYFYCKIKRGRVIYFSFKLQVMLQCQQCGKQWVGAKR